MLYEFMHKDKVVGIANDFKQLRQIYMIQELPIGTYSNNPILRSRLFESWLHGRTIPQDRQNKTQIESILHMSISNAYLESLDVSLTDCYWFRPQGSNLKWKDVNFLDNGFSQDFAKRMLYNTSNNIDINIPDITTDGTLKKVWVSINNEPTLIKYGDLDKRSQNKHMLSANEVIASEISNILNINHAQYYPIRVQANNSLGNVEIVCACPCIIQDSNLEMVNMLQLTHMDRKYQKMGIKNLYESIGNEKALNDMLFLDAFLENIGRHERNIAFIKNADSPEILSAAPLYDSGSCLAFSSGEELKPFSMTTKEQLEYVYNKDNRYFKNLDLDYIKKIIISNYEIFGIPESLCNESTKIINKNFNIVKEIVNKQILVQKKYEEDNYER